MLDDNKELATLSLILLGSSLNLFINAGLLKVRWQNNFQEINNYFMLSKPSCNFKRKVSSSSNVAFFLFLPHLALLNLTEKKMRRWKKRRARRARKMIQQQMNKGRKDSSGREKPWLVGAERFVFLSPVILEVLILCIVILVEIKLIVFHRFGILT